MVVTVFRIHLRPGVDLVALEALGLRMVELASAMPGFVSYKDFAAADGENVSIVEFEDEASLRAWRNHPEHLEAQRRGRDEYFADFHIQVCQPLRDYRFEAGR
jgi:heme-degrading monooxygenase HmoA